MLITQLIYDLYFVCSLFESPDEELKMDISENTNTESPPLFASPDERLFTTSSSSNTISSHAPPAPHIENLDTLMYNDEKLEEIVNTVTKNMNSLTTSNDSHLKDDLTNRNPGLTPVNSHPLMMMNRDSEESEDSFNRVTNFPDVVPEIEQKHQPLRLANPNPVIQSNTSTTTKSLDVLNNSKRSPRKAFYREPSPVSQCFHCSRDYYYYRFIA